ncbi:hypothetical protein [Ohtaekwangia sp.]
MQALADRLSVGGKRAYKSIAAARILLSRKLEDQVTGKGKTEVQVTIR